MPNRDGTGPQGKGSGTGRGRGMRDEQCPECGKEKPREENQDSSAGEGLDGKLWPVPEESAYA